MEEMSMPGAFPTAAVEDVPRVPKKKFIGARTAAARAKQQDVGGSVEESTAIVQSGEIKRHPLKG